jgi:hypothetical protein
MAPTQAINPSPFKTIPAVIYNGLPTEVKVAIGGPVDSVTIDVPIGTDGHAMIFNLANALPRAAGTWEENAVSVYDQVIPKPFCADGPYDYVYVAGPVALNQVTELTVAGEYISTFRAEGELYITPVNPMTGEPIGETMRAVVREHHDAYLSNSAVRASSFQHQSIVPPAADGAGKLMVRLKVSTQGANGYEVSIQCGDD